MNQYPGYNVQPDQPLQCLKTSIMAIGIIGFVIWIPILGVAAGFCFEPYGMDTTRVNGFLLVVVHAAYIFFTSEILYLVTFGGTFSNDDLRKLRTVTSKLLAATMIGVGINISAIIHAIIYGFDEWWHFRQGDIHIYEDNTDSIIAAFSCSFSYIWTVILFICTAVFNSKSHVMMKFGGVARAPGNMQLPGMPQQPMATAAGNVGEVMRGMDNRLFNMQPQSRVSYAPSDRIGPCVPPRV